MSGDADNEEKIEKRGSAEGQEPPVGHDHISGGFAVGEHVQAENRKDDADEKRHEDDDGKHQDQRDVIPQTRFLCIRGFPVFVRFHGESI